MMRRLTDATITTFGFGLCLANLLTLLTLLASFRHDTRWMVDFGGRPMVWLDFREGALSANFASHIDGPPTRSSRTSDVAGIRVENRKWIHRGSSFGWRHTSLELPWWASLVVLCLPFWPLHFVLSGPVLRAFRRLRGRCARCGYNLRGSPSNVCSECGEAFDPANHPTARKPQRTASAKPAPSES